MVCFYQRLAALTTPAIEIVKRLDPRCKAYSFASCRRSHPAVDAATIHKGDSFQQAQLRASLSINVETIAAAARDEILRSWRQERHRLITQLPSLFLPFIAGQQVE